MTALVEPTASVVSTTLDAALHRLGLTLDDAARDLARADLGRSLRQDPTTGAVHALDDGGNPRTAVQDGLAVDAGVDGVIDVVREIAERHSASATLAPTASAASGNLTEKMRLRQAEEAASLRRQAEDFAAASNPWVSGNLTHRMLISRHLPEVAERLKREAGR